MKVQEFRVKKIVTTKGELISINEWDSFVMYYALDKHGMTDWGNWTDDEQFVLSPGDAAIFNLLPADEADKLEKFYQDQLDQ